MTAIRPFRIDVDQDRLDDLADRLGRVVWPNVPDGADGHGIPIARVRELVDHWRERFDWRALEAELNGFGHVVHEAGEYPLHLLVERSGGDGVPIVLLHGWPDAFLRYRKLVRPLVEAGHDVLVPSLPGFGFSGQPAAPLSAADVAARVAAALADLGVTRYALHGGDFGAVVADELLAADPAAVAALHLTDVPFTRFFGVDRSTLSADERKFAEASDAWLAGATYLAVQTAVPLTLAYGLTDSPVALLAWFAERFDEWSDEVDADDVVALTALTWLTRTAWSGMRLYADDDGSTWDEDAAGSWGDAAADGDAADGAGLWAPIAADAWTAEAPRADVPVGLSLFPRDIASPPREYAERFYRVEFFRRHERGGHLAATERPAALAADLVGFLSGRD